MGGKVVFISTNVGRVSNPQWSCLPTLNPSLTHKDICANKKIISLWLRLESTTSVVQLIHIGVKIRKVRGFASDFFFCIVAQVSDLWLSNLDNLENRLTDVLLSLIGQNLSQWLEIATFQDLLFWFFIRNNFQNIGDINICNLVIFYRSEPFRD